MCTIIQYKQLRFTYPNLCDVTKVLCIMSQYLQIVNDCTCSIFLMQSQSTMSLLSATGQEC